MNSLQQLLAGLLKWPTINTTTHYQPTDSMCWTHVVVVVADVCGACGLAASASETSINIAVQITSTCAPAVTGVHVRATDRAGWHYLGSSLHHLYHLQSTIGLGVGEFLINIIYP